MEKGRVPANGDDRLVVAELSKLSQSCCQTNSGAHGVEEVHLAFPLRENIQSITPDVASHINFALIRFQRFLEGPKSCPVWASGAPYQAAAYQHFVHRVRQGRGVFGRYRLIC